MKLRRSENDAVVEMLKKVPICSGLSEKELKSMVKLSRERRFESGDNIVRKGEEGVGFYLIIDGAVEIRSDGNTLSKLGPGQFFGEMSVLDRQPRSADVVAVEPSRCLVLNVLHFKSAISNNPEISLKLLQEFTRRLRATNQAIGE